MNIKQIIVDELPENCRKCDLMLYSISQKKYYCYVNKKTIYPSLCPSWCPLEIEQEQVCEWVFRVFDGKDMYNSPESCGYHATYPEFTFCPNCGKRIKYKSEE